MEFNRYMPRAVPGLNNLHSQLYMKAPAGSPFANGQIPLGSATAPTSNTTLRNPLGAGDSFKFNGKTYYVPNGTATGGSPAGAAKTAGAKTGGLFDSLKGKASEGWNNVKAGKGLIPSAKTMSNVMAGVQLANAIGTGYNEYNQAQMDTESLISDILASAGGNSNLRYDLSSDQLNLLRQLQNGTFDTSADFDISNAFGNLGNVATQAAMGYAFGGIPGAILSGLTPVASGITSGMTQDQRQITARLEGLYNSLAESEMRNKAMKRDAAMQRYANSLY